MDFANYCISAHAVRCYHGDSVVDVGWIHVDVDNVELNWFAHQLMYKPMTSLGFSSSQVCQA